MRVTTVNSTYLVEPSGVVRQRQHLLANTTVSGPKTIIGNLGRVQGQIVVGQRMRIVGKRGTTITSPVVSVEDV